jgi:hypothetical protein
MRKKMAIRIGYPRNSVYEKLHARSIVEKVLVLCDSYYFSVTQ